MDQLGFFFSGLPRFRNDAALSLSLSCTAFRPLWFYGQRWLAAEIANCQYLFLRQPQTMDFAIFLFRIVQGACISAITLNYQHHKGFELITDMML